MFGLRRKALALLLLTASLSCASLGLCQQPPPGEPPAVTIKVKVNLVLVPTRVISPSGKPVLDLQRGDFRVYENGKEQDVSVFAPVDSPLHVALVIDTSDSTLPHLPLLKAAAQRFVDRLENADQVALYDIGPEVVRVHRYSKDHKAVKQAIGKMRAAEGINSANRFAGAAVLKPSNARAGTLLYDGLALVREDFPAEAQRRAILAFSDAWDAGSTVSFDTLSSRLLQSSEVLFAVLPARAEEKTSPLFQTQEAQQDSSPGKKNGDLGGLPVAGPPLHSTWTLVLDLSGVAEENIGPFQEAAREFLSELPAQARVWLFDYRYRLRPLAFPGEGVDAPMEIKPRTPEEALRLLPASSDVASYPMLPVKRPISILTDKVLVLTDRRETGLLSVARSMHANPSALAVLRIEEMGDPAARKNVVQILINDPLGISEVSGSYAERLSRRMEEDFQKLARDTGGEALRIERSEDLETAYQQIAEKIRTSYTLGYYTQAHAGRYALEVKVPGREVTIHARRAVVVD